MNRKTPYTKEQIAEYNRKYREKLKLEKQQMRELAFKKGKKRKYDCKMFSEMETL